MQTNPVPLFAAHPIKPDSFAGPRSVGAGRTSTHGAVNLARSPFGFGQANVSAGLVSDRTLGVAAIDFSATCKIRHLLEHLIA